MSRIAETHASALAIFLCALVCFAGCAPDRSSNAPGYIQADVESAPLTLDPRFATDAISSRITELIFDSLVKLDERGRFIGELAQSIDRPSPTVLVFHLRRDARFSDGRPLTARDVKFTYDSVIDPTSRSPKRAGFEPLLSVAAPDDYTVVMRTRRPYAPALEMAMLGIVPKGSPATRTALNPPAGSGPMRLGAFVRDEQVTLERNPFSSAPPSSIRGIIFKVVPDPTVRALELAKGVCDFAENNIQPDLLGYLSEQPNLRIVRSPGIAYRYIAFSFRDPRLRDVRIRRAIAYATDRDAIVKSLMAGTARVATGMLAPENWAYEGDVRQYPFDPAIARRLLEEAGYSAGADRMRGITLTFKTTPEQRRLGEVLQAMLSEVGIRLEVRPIEFATFYSDIEHGSFELTSMDWVGINDPHHYLMVFDSQMTPPRGLNRGWYANPEMDSLLDQGDTTIDPQARRSIYAAVQQLAAADLPYISLWWEDNVIVMNRRLSGFIPFPNGSLRSLPALTFSDDLGPRPVR